MKKNEAEEHTQQKIRAATFPVVSPPANG